MSTDTFATSGEQREGAAPLAKIYRCDGNCEETHGGHAGDVQRVSVTGWGEFNYCDNAIAEDRQRGLEVTRIPRAALSLATKESQ